jgi:hypothetical protein
VISKYAVAIFDQKEVITKFSAVFFSSAVSDPDSFEMVDPDPDSTDPDPQLCLLVAVPIS